MKKLAAWQIGLLVFLVMLWRGQLESTIYMNPSPDPEQVKVENETDEAEQLSTNGIAAAGG